jgi:hypothetical protein
MFWDLKGAFVIRRFLRARQSPATIVLLPTWEAVPRTISDIDLWFVVRADNGCDQKGRRATSVTSKYIFTGWKGYSCQEIYNENLKV